MVFGRLDGTWAHSLSWLPWRILQQMALHYADLGAFGYTPGRSVTRLYVVLFLGFCKNCHMYFHSDCNIYIHINRV